MSISGFGSADQEDMKNTDSNSHENYKHVIKLFGVPVFTSTKVHNIESKIKEDK